MASKASSLIPRGVIFMNILVEGKTPTDVAVKADLNSWIGFIPIPYTGALDSVDPQPTMETFFAVDRDKFIVIDLKTMKFIDIFNADAQGAVDLVESML